MTHGFQQQDTGLGYAFPKSAVMPQHGEKARPLPLPVPPPRSQKPRPGH
jgi:hypothetical protein